MGRPATPEVGNYMSEELKAEDKGYLNGVFHFSNNSDEDFIFLWNNKEYNFLKKTCSPMVIQGATPEEVQTIRKRAAYKWAEREWYKGSEYKKMAKMGGGLPPTRDDKTLEPLVQMCLNPLPIQKAEVKEGKKDKRVMKASKTIAEGAFDPKADFKVEE